MFADCIDCSVDGGVADRSDMQSLNPQVELLGRLISATDLRQKVISQNLANVNTPHYQRLDVDFEQQLARELNSASAGAGVAAAAPVVQLTPGLIARADGNNVDIDHEIGQLNKNALLQQVYLQLLGTELNQMRMAIEGG